MKKNNVINLSDYRKEKEPPQSPPQYIQDFEVEGYYIYPELGVMMTIDETASFVRCQVRDNGCGIPDEKQAKIFEAYFTTKSADKGTGLGLSVVKQIIEEYDGKISVASAVGEGTTFTIFLPPADD